MSKTDKKSKKKGIITAVIEIAIIVAVIFLVFFFLTNYIGRIAIVDGDSMNPTLNDGDVIVISERAYLEKDPERFDLVVFPYDNQSNYIKRIIALPGETVQIVDGKIMINGTYIKEYYGNEPIDENYSSPDLIRLGEDEYFVMGDNRNNSVDSRSIGPVSKSDITGKALFRLLPLGSFGSLEDQ